MSDRLYRTVRAGYMALTDCAPLIIAQELGFDLQEGIRLEPVRMNSWSGIRDGLAFEKLECAHMPGALALAMHLGLSGMKTGIRVPLLLGHGGNGITVSTDLYEEAAAILGSAMPTTRSESGMLVRVVAEKRKANKQPRLRLGAVHAFSSLNYELRAWLAHAGLDPDVDVELIVVPRPKMVEALAIGEIDGFSVGDPWGQLAVEAGIGRIVATKADLYPYSPEKVLAFRSAWVEGHYEIAVKTAAVVSRALGWAAQEENHAELAQILTQEEYLDLPEEVLSRALDCKPKLAPDTDGEPVARYLDFSGDNQPTKADAMWLLAQMRRWEQVKPGCEAEVADVFKPFEPIGSTVAKLEVGSKKDPAAAAFDGVDFTEGDVEAYKQAFAV